MMRTRTLSLTVGLLLLLVAGSAAAPSLADVCATEVTGTSDESASPRMGLPPEPPFPDVPFDHWAADFILACVDAGIVQGYQDGYHPDEPVSRAQMAVYVARALAGGDADVPAGPSAGHFTDVSADHWAYRHIEYCSAISIVEGYPDGTYHPDEALNRAQMAVYIARSVVSPPGDAYIPDPAPDDPPVFPDVTADSEWAWCYKHVQYIAGLEPPVVQGYWDGTYRPDMQVTRDQMAVYVARAFQLPM